MSKPITKLDQQKVIRRITNIRKRNNNLWMGLLALALETSPKRAKMIIQTINRNDKQISDLLGRL